MPKYEAYAKSKDTPSRKNRKGSRRTTFLLNSKAGRKQRKDRHDARVAIQEAREAALQAAQEPVEEEVVGE